MENLTYWKIALEIAFLWYGIYMILLFIKGTRAEQLIKGLIIVGSVFLLAQQFRLESINWALERVFPISVIAFVIIFQPELRRVLARLGQFGIHQEDMAAIDEAAKAALQLSAKKTGALIAIEREAGLRTYIESGVSIDSKVVADLIISIFLPHSPLHDGAVIIQRGRLVAAGCILPLTQEDTGAFKSLGTRHRAAVSLSEETDAVCIVVSEETGGISVASAGRLTRNLSEEALNRTLREIFSRPKRRIHIIPGWPAGNRNSEGGR